MRLKLLDSSDYPYHKQDRLFNRVSNIKFSKIVRYTTQAKYQGGYLTQPDLSYLLGIHTVSLQRLIDENRVVIIPLRGRECDIGRGITHRRKIIELYLQMYTETEITARTGHSYEAIEGYLKEFAAICALKDKGMPPPLIRKVLKRSRKLVKAYLELLKEYDGASGYYLDRPALDRLRDAARDGLIDILLVQDPDRLARRYAYQVLLLEEFKRWGVDIRFLKQPPPKSPEQQLLIQIQGVISEYERARIMERTRRGRIYWARQGRPVCSHVPFAYRYLSRTKDKPPSVEVEEEAAKIVRQIFEWYVDEGLSGHQIGLRLTDMKVPSPKVHMSYWDPSSVRTILKNEAYLGTWYLNQYRMEPRAGHIRPRKVKRAKKEWIPVPIPHLISSQMFIKAQEIREKGGRVGPKPLRYPDTHLLRRLAVCKPCGRKMTCHNSLPDGHRYVI